MTDSCNPNRSAGAADACEPDPPIACVMGALDDAARESHVENVKALFRRVEEIAEAEDGYALRTPADADTLARVGAFIGRERLCCPFLRFALAVDPGAEKAWLRLGGGDQIKAYLATETLPYVRMARPDVVEATGIEANGGVSAGGRRGG